MLKSLGQFLVHGFWVLWLVLTLVHLGLFVAGGNPVDLLVDSRLSPAQQAALEKKFGYDAPPLEQYGRYLAAVAQGDFGISFLYKAPVAKVLLPRMGKSALLGSLALLFALLFSLILLLALHRSPYRSLKKIAEGWLQLIIAVPAFVWAPIMIAWLARSWEWFPSYGSRSLFLDQTSPLSVILDTLWHALLPAFCLSLPLAGQLTAYLHEQLRHTEQAPFIMSARGRGVSARNLFWNHQFRHVLPSLVQWLGLYFPILAAGAVVIEAIFGWPGLGLVLLDAVLGRDYPLLLGGCIWMTCLVVPSYKLADWFRQSRAES